MKMKKRIKHLREDLEDLRETVDNLATMQLRVNHLERALEVARYDVGIQLRSLQDEKANWRQPIDQANKIVERAESVVENMRAIEARARASIVALVNKKNEIETAD